MNSQSTADGSVWTFHRLLQWTTEYLHRRSIPEARLASEVLLAHATGLARIELYTRFDGIPDESQLDRFREWVRRAGDHEPIPYLVEEKEFFSLPFRVTRDVLIPRPESETIVECVLDHWEKTRPEKATFLDVGTGSGCLAVAALTQCERACGVATDISAEALDVARCNAQRHGVLDRMALVQADLLALPAGTVPEGGFELLMCNPPYIAADAVKDLAVNVRDYEPRAALTDGFDGLSFYRSLACQGPTILRPGALVIVEIADEGGPAVGQVFEQTGSFVYCGTWKDRVSGNPRVMIFAFATKP